MNRPFSAERIMEEIISIIVPVYNAEKTLERCVRSLLGQTYPHIEVILVNDGSRDGSLELCRRFAEEDVRVCVVDQPNGGVSAARNAGLDAATGNFVMFCDSDDWVSPDWCRLLRQQYVPGNLTVCRYQRWDGGDVHPETSDVAVETARRQDFLHYPMWMCSPCIKLFDRSVIEEYSIRFSRELSMGEDFCFVLEYLCAVSGDVRFLSAPLYYYDVSTEGSLSKRVPPLNQCELLYHKITAAMEALGAVDAESRKNRDWLVAPHFEHLFRKTVEQDGIPCRKKRKAVDEMGKSEAFRNCSANSISWGNPIYLWFYKHKYLRMAMMLRLIRSGCPTKIIRMRKEE